MSDTLKRLFQYLNPIKQLGTGKYSIMFPLITMLVLIGISELYSYYFAHSPNTVDSYVIYIPIILIIYFSLRDGIKGGLTGSFLTVLYYAWIMYSRNFRGNREVAGIETTVILGILYIIFAWIIGWLKQTIDKLIEQEANEKRRMQAIIQQLPVGVLITDDRGRLTERNKKVDEIFDLKLPVGFQFGADEIQSSVINGKNIYPEQSTLTRAIQTGKAVLGKEYQIKRNDGKGIYIQVSVSPIQNKTGKVIAVASIITDITQQKELEIRKDDFVNMASHELKTPITSMKLYLDVLSAHLQKSSDNTAIKTLNSIKNQVDKLQELVNDLLDVSRLQTGKLSLREESFRLDALIEETVNDLQGTTKKQRIIISKKTPIVVHADRFRIYQVFTNFITNAVKYSPTGTEIKVQVKKSDGKAVVSVQDQGIGIAKEQQKKIFEKLYQVTDPREKTFPGLGMGLYISKEIIQRHKGQIWVESEKDKGSTFFFSLPLTKREHN